jgi:stearoyl-CoA 9-desaturase NADPH oxidoreductase
MHTTVKKSPFNFLLNAVLEPRDADFWLQKINPLWSVEQALGKIVHKDPSAQDTVSFTLKTNKHFQMGEAGQHHPVFVVVNGVRYERTYSLSKIDSEHVLLTVKKVTGGKVSTWLLDHAQIGDILELGQPFGDMTLPKTTAPLLLLAAGSGITPMYSLLQSLVQTQQITDQNVTLLYWVKTQADAVFLKQFQAWAQQYSNFNFQLLCTQEAPQAARLNAEHLALVTDLEQATVYACGPSGFVQQVETVFKQAKAIATEAFSITTSSSAEVGFVNVTLTQSKQVLTIPKGQSILVSLEQQNIKPKHGCRMGICNKCACNKVEGSTANILNGSQNAEPGNLLKICVNSAQSDLIIDL